MVKAAAANALYPWDIWFARKRSYTLRHGRHYDCLTHGMAAQIRNAAYRRRIRVSIQILDSQSLRVTNGERIADDA